MSSRRRSQRAVQRRSRAPVFAALGDETRLSLVATLCDRQSHSISQLTHGSKLTRQAVTKHLLILEDANLVVTEKRGREKLHYLNPIPIHDIADRWIGKYERGRLRALGDLKKKLERKEP